MLKVASGPVGILHHIASYYVRHIPSPSVHINFKAIFYLKICHIYVGKYNYVICAFKYTYYIDIGTKKKVTIRGIRWSVYEYTSWPSTYIYILRCICHFPFEFTLLRIFRRLQVIIFPTPENVKRHTTVQQRPIFNCSLQLGLTLNQMSFNILKWKSHYKEVSQNM